MDSNNYVAQRDGQWIVVINGQQVGSFATQQEAEQAYNAAAGPGQGQQEPQPTGGGGSYDTPNGPKTLEQMRAELAAAGYSGPQDANSIHMTYVGVSGDGNPLGGYDAGMQAMIDAALAGNREKFEESVRQFNLTFGEGQRQFDRSLYSNTALGLLGNAVELGSRPADYFKFNEYTSGGKDIFQQLFGNNPRPDFSSPTGPIEPGNIAELMRRLGITVAPGTPAAPGPGGTINTPSGPRTLAQIEAELRAAGYNGPWDAASMIAAYQRTAVPQADAQQAAAPFAAQAAKPMGATPQAPMGITANAQQRAAALKAGTPPAQLQATPVGVPPLPAPTPGTPPRAIPPGNAPLPAPGTPTPGTPAPATPPAALPQPAANPYGPQLAQLSQMNPGSVLPGNINALGPVGMGLLQGALGKAGWDPQEWLYQHMQARPKGQAARRTATAYQQPMGVY